MADETRQDERAPDARPADADERERAAGAERDDGTEVEEDLDALLEDVKRERDEYL